MREWHDLRFAQRQVLMSSMALSNKVLTLTGRMSMFRATIITDPEFIYTVQHDSLSHWRLGKFKFLTGDDKSSWYHVLRDGWDMLYVPDAVIITIEHPPAGNFFQASTKLMFRWFGNMLRTNGRALALGPWRTGFFTWWCIFDQRISMWTSLTGPIFATMLVMKYSLAFLPIYIIWITLTRWVMAVMLLAARPVLSWYYPFLIYFNQVWGSLVKTHVFFRLDRQSWTRQKTKLQRNLTPLQQLYQDSTTVIVNIAAWVIFVAIIGTLSGVMSTSVGG
jgi:glycosyltransferase Alg8